MTKAARSSGDDRVSRARAVLIAAALLTVGGIVLTAIGTAKIGITALATGWIAFAYGLHAFGRSPR